MTKKSDKLRDMDKPTVLGYELHRDTLTPKRGKVDLNKPGDHGADPHGDGKFRMVPSGDIVDAAERERRLGKKTIRHGIREDAPTNSMGFSSSTPGTGAIDTFDPLLGRKKKAKEHILKTLKELLKKEGLRYGSSPGK